MSSVHHHMTNLYITVDSALLRWCLKPFLQNLDDALKKDLISKNPLALMVFRNVDESMRRHAVMCHYEWFVMSFRKEPLAVREHPNFAHVRLLAFQLSLACNGPYVAGDILDNELTDDELLWCLRRLMPKAKKMLRSPRIMKPRAALFDRLLSTTQNDLDAKGELSEWFAYSSEKLINLMTKRQGEPVVPQEWILCLYSTIFRYCLELIVQHKPKHSRHIQNVMKAITLKCLTDPLVEPRMTGFGLDYGYHSFQRVVVEMQARLPVDVLLHVYQQQGQWLSDECLRSDVDLKHRTKLLDVWLSYWSFDINKLAKGTDAYNTCCVIGWRPFVVPLIPYGMISELFNEDADLPDNLVKPLRRFFKYAMECRALDVSTLDAFGDASVFILKSAITYIKDARFSGLSASESQELEDYLTMLVSSKE